MLTSGECKCNKNVAETLPVGLKCPLCLIGKYIATGAQRVIPLTANRAGACSHAVTSQNRLFGSTHLVGPANCIKYGKIALQAYQYISPSAKH